MKLASPTILAIMATGQMRRIDLYAFTLAGGTQTYYFTSHQQPVIVGGQLYQTGLVIKRGPLKQVAGLQVQSMQLTCTPQSDSASGAPMIAGLPFLAACKAKVFDSARVLFSKMFLTSFDDLSPGAVPWYQGRVNKVNWNRLQGVFAINDDIEMLNVQSPPNILQVGCAHTVFDPGCGLNPNDFQVTGAVTAGSTVLNVNTSLTQPADFFTRGRITFMTGANATTPLTTYFVKKFIVGQFQLVRPLPSVPQAGDSFVALPGCKLTIPACANADTTIGPVFNNLKRNRSTPFIPVPETLYDGGTAQITTTQIGSDGGASVGTPFSSGVGQRGGYKP